MQTLDWDYTILDSGFGDSVSGLRLSLIAGQVRFRRRFHPARDGADAAGLRSRRRRLAP
jgi:hypothetical protein